jgi:hypothetical protein
MEKIPGIFKEKGWESLKVQAKVTKEQIDDLTKNFGIDVTSMTDNALSYELEMGLIRKMMEQLDKNCTKRKLFISVAEESPRDCILISSPRLASEIMIEKEFLHHPMDSSSGGNNPLHLIGSYKGKKIYASHLIRDEKSVYQLTSDFIEYKLPTKEQELEMNKIPEFSPDEKTIRKVLYYKIHSISPECKRYEVEETLHS